MSLAILLLDTETKAISEVMDNSFSAPAPTCFALLMAVKRYNIAILQETLCRLRSFNLRMKQVANVTRCETMVSSLGLSFEKSYEALQLYFLGECRPLVVVNYELHAATQCSC